MKLTVDEILSKLETMFPEAGCELNYNNLFQLSIAVILSAQTTDISVNKVTPALFKQYPDMQSMAKASAKELEPFIKNLGLYRNKAKSLVGFSQSVIENFDSQIPDNRKDLMKLPGVGRKTANVILSEYFKIPAIAVDTHVDRVSKRLGLAKENDSVLQVEQKLQKKIPKEKWSQAHHLFIFFGRYHCKAMKPDCLNCPFTDNCKYYKKKHLK